MNIIAVDDERLALSSLERAIVTAAPEARVACFTDADEALYYADRNCVDVAFLDIHLGNISGLFLAKSLKDKYSKTNIIFVTAYSQYMTDAFAMHASGYVVKPIDPGRVREELENLRNPLKKPIHGLRAQTFGNFEIFTDGKPIHFPRAKSKEILAYLIHKHGTSCTMAELAAVLEEESADNVRRYIADMRKVLKEEGYGDVIIKTRNSIAIDTSGINCDLYRFLKADAAAVNAYTGEYMAQYSWAEFMIGYLNEKVMK